jgi:choloylglycine hydrolase
MDYGMNMARQVVFVPKGKNTTLNYSGDSKRTNYSCLGMGIRIDDTIALFDGINESGLMGALLYFPEYAHYSYNVVEGKDNLAPDHVISYVLGQYKNLAEVEQAFKNKINIVKQKEPLKNFRIVLPLHYIFSDGTGKSVIIEPQEDGIHVITDSIGVMTNSPDYTWHERNLRNYLTVNSMQHEPIQFLGKTLRPFGQGSGVFGLPGGYTPVDRFVRVAFLKQNSFQPRTETEAITLSHHILESVSIPRGVVRKEDNDGFAGKIDYTNYSAYMCSESHVYYYSTYGNQRIRCVQLDKLKNETDYQEFKVDGSEDILHIN